MDYGRAIGDAFRMTFTSRAQWIWALIWMAINIAVVVVFYAILFVVVFGIVGLSAGAAFDPAAASSDSAAFENVGAGICGAFLIGALLVMALIVASTYVSAWLSAGLVSIAARTAGGHPPRLSESWSMARADAKRVWGIQWLSLYLPGFVIGVVLYIVFGVVMVAAGFAAAPSGELTPDALGRMFLGFGVFGLILMVVYGLLYAWSELSVRHAVLGRMRATQSLGAGMRSFTSRFGGTILILLVIGAVMVAWYAISFGVGFVQAQIPDMRVYWVAYLSWLVITLVASMLLGILFSNLWTMFGFQVIAASPPPVARAGYAPAAASPPPPAPGVVGTGGVPQPPHPPQPPEPPQYAQGLPLAQPQPESSDVARQEDQPATVADTESEEASGEFFDA
ncbi:MAG: hypothetical protein OEV43_00130 [Coriobacteriia bacterium]|nr:hypothetical protein [Coriobacteriia bacterium]